MTEYRYCWIKVVKLAGDRPLPEDRTDVAVWAYQGGELQAFVTPPPLPVERLAARPELRRAASATSVGVLGNCTPCPVGHQNVPIFERFLRTPPPSPVTLDDGSITTGWQLEIGSASENIDDAPEIYLAAYPLPAGTSREDALAWLQGAGASWADGAVTCSLLAHFEDKP